MDKDKLKQISSAVDSLGVINRALTTLQNTDWLYVITDYSINCGLHPGDEIFIPQCLVEEFKQKLLDYYTQKYNEIVDDLKKVTL
jgi:hypothetical protein